MESTRYPATRAATVEVVGAKAALSPIQSFGIFVSHLVAVAAIAALGTALVTVALALAVLLAPALVVVFVHVVRRHDRIRLRGAAV
jgi:hypothetical protein